MARIGETLAERSDDVGAEVATAAGLWVQDSFGSVNDKKTARIGNVLMCSKLLFGGTLPFGVARMQFIPLYYVGTCHFKSVV